MAQLTITPRNLSEARQALGGYSSKVIGNNTELRDLGTSVVATLHGNHIVRYTEDAVEATWAGWPSHITQDRLNQLASPARFSVRGGLGHVDGEEVLSTEWVKISR